MPSSDRHIELIARGLLRRGRFVLLCRNLEGGYAFLPGGHIEFGESAAAALARELEEECALRVKVGRLGLVSEGTFQTRKRTHHEVNLVFHVEQVGGTGGPDDAPPPPVESLEEHIGFEWVDVASLQEVDLRPAAAKAWIMAGAGIDDAAPERGGADASCAEWVSEIAAGA